MRLLPQGGGGCSGWTKEKEKKVEGRFVGPDRVRATHAKRGKRVDSITVVPKRQPCLPKKKGSYRGKSTGKVSVKTHSVLGAALKY